MNGIHDMGGMDGFGKVEAPPAEPPFHEAWEGRVLSMNRAMVASREWNIDEGRYGIEILPAHLYLMTSYYERWFLRLENMCVEAGLVTREEIAKGHADGKGRPLKGEPLTPANIAKTYARGSFGRPAAAPARFKVGDRVRARNMHPTSHTRLPRFARGHEGVVERIHGAHVLPDIAVSERREEAAWLYTVVFDGRELWGPDSDPTVSVSIDAFEPYLEAVS
ncbi:MAG: nitrile hydratase subunit beta [Hyphomicrobiaceae bacterium]|nr:nitrile hydratase subunit beta [Hyphomicrobiaceae bacterium]